MIATVLMVLRRVIVCHLDSVCVNAVGRAQAYQMRSAGSGAFFGKVLVFDTLMTKGYDWFGYCFWYHHACSGKNQRLIWFKRTLCVLNFKNSKKRRGSMF